MLMEDARFRFETGAVTHNGCVRDHNEDRYMSDPALGVWLVADGMGGHYGGEVAAQAIVDRVATMERAPSAPDLQARFLRRVEQANQDILAHSESVGGATIGATLAAILTHDGNYAAVWCGDSRIYKLRDGVLTQISRDHNEANELLDSGAITEEQAANWPRKNVLSRAIGVRAEVETDRVYGKLRDCDTFLLCSDGLTGHLSDDDITELMRGRSAQRACDALLEETLKRGATDNVTVVIMRCALKTVVSGSEMADYGS